MVKPSKPVLVKLFNFQSSTRSLWLQNLSKLSASPSTSPTCKWNFRLQIIHGHSILKLALRISQLMKLAFYLDSFVNGWNTIYSLFDVSGLVHLTIIEATFKIVCDFSAKVGLDRSKQQFAKQSLFVIPFLFEDSPKYYITVKDAPSYLYVIKVYILVNITPHCWAYLV